ncbi:hypothetical protein ACQU0X_08455 [Pseudovibrio ascidiaceicola]|uniref:hypothetical protein n=1 Tax=Pseudovibrio ascidiaceicola TaxID=285279 RepID=UPI003D369E53
MSAVNHEILLMKYLNFIGEMEGTTFLRSALGTDFTDEEYAELKRLDEASLGQSPVPSNGNPCVEILPHQPVLR